jgi:Big-like domain-containing protein
VKRIITRGLASCLLAAALLGGLAAPSALADHQTGSVSLSVTKQGDGRVDGDGDDGISCGEDCSQTYTLDETCVFVGVGGGGNHSQGRVQCDTIYPDVDLTATGTNGFVLDHWSGGGCSSGFCHPFVKGTPTEVAAHFRDIAPPAVNFQGPADGSEIGGTAYVFSATPTDNHQVASVAYRIDGQTFATSFASPYRVTLDTRRRPDTSPIPNGSTVSLTAIATDHAGLTANVTRSYIVDNAVSARFTTVPDDFTSATIPQVGFTSDDGDVVGYVCTTSRNGVRIAGPAPCASPYLPPAAQDGSYDVLVQPTDNQGNTATFADAFVIDRTPPAVAVTTPAEGAVLNGGITPAFTITETNNNPGQTKCRLDGGPFGPCATVPTPSPDGNHTLTVRAVDRAGNVGEDSNSFVVDTTPPQLGFTNGPAAGEIIATNTARFSFGATDPHGPIGYSCRLDSGAFGGCSGAQSHDLSSLSDGPHTFAVRALDRIGNASVRERQFVVNAVRPSVEIVDGLPDGVVTAADVVAFRFQAAGGEVACSLDSDSTFRACSGSDSDTLSGLDSGTHVFRVRVRDEANDQVVAARSFRVDRSRPETAIDAGPANGSLAKGGRVTFAFSSVPGSTYQCRFGRLGALGAFGPCSGPGNTHAVSGLKPARYAFEVFAVNALSLADLTPARRTFTLTRSLEVRVGNVWQRRGDKTSVFDLNVKQVPAGAKVAVSCNGKGCPFKKKRANVRNGVAKLTNLFKQRALSAGAVVEIRVSAPGAIARIVRFTMRTGEFPKRQDLCRPPGASRPRAC